MKFLKVGRVAIITRGRFAGKKVRLFQPGELTVATTGRANFWEAGREVKKASQKDQAWRWEH